MNNYTMNHHPIQTGIWFPYDGGRYKDHYDLKLKTGEIVENCYPNANAWYPHSNSEGRPQITDDQVAEIRLKPEEELHTWAMKGKARIKRTLSLFAGWVPDWPEGYPTMDDILEDTNEETLTEEDATQIKLRQTNTKLREEDKREERYKEYSSVNSYTKKNDGNMEAISAAEAKRQRRQERNLRNKI